MNKPEFTLYGWNTPNGQKIILALEEVAANYQYQPIDISQGEQHTAAFKRLSPDGKIPALIHSAEPEITLFESGAILLYLAHLYPAIHGSNTLERVQVMSWTFWQIGQLGPLAGQFGRFHAITPINTPAIHHFEQLVWRCLDVLENRLSESTFLAAEHFTVADITSFTWVTSNQSYLQKYNIAWREKCPSIVRWSDTILEKPSARKALGL